MGCIHRNMTPQSFPHDCRVPYGPGRRLLWSIHQLLIPETSVQEVEQDSAIRRCHQTSMLLPVFFQTTRSHNAQSRPNGNVLRASSATTLPAISIVYNEQVSIGKTSDEDTPTSWGVGYNWEVLRLLSGQIPVGQEMVLPLEVRNWLLLVECILREKWIAE